jgi:hypothetical protein
LFFFWSFLNLLFSRYCCWCICTMNVIFNLKFNEMKRMNFISLFLFNFTWHRSIRTLHWIQSSKVTIAFISRSCSSFLTISFSCIVDMEVSCQNIESQNIEKQNVEQVKYRRGKTSKKITSNCKMSKDKHRKPNVEKAKRRKSKNRREKYRKYKMPKIF